MISQLIYVQKDGNDTTNDGSILKPFLTIAHALSLIIDASEIKIYSINVGPGVFFEPEILLKPYVYIRGQGRSATRIAVANNLITLDPLFSLQNGRCGLIDMYFEANANFDLEEFGGKYSCVIELQDTFFNGEVSFKGRNNTNGESADFIEWLGGYCFGLNLYSSQGHFDNLVLDGATLTIDASNANTSFTFNGIIVTHVFLKGTFKNISYFYGSHIKNLNVNNSIVNIDNSSLPSKENIINNGTINLLNDSLRSDSTIFCIHDDDLQNIIDNAKPNTCIVLGSNKWGDITLKSNVTIMGLGGSKNNQIEIENITFDDIEDISISNVFINGNIIGTGDSYSNVKIDNCNIEGHIQITNNLTAMYINNCNIDAKKHNKAAIFYNGKYASFNNTKIIGGNNAFNIGSSTTKIDLIHCKLQYDIPTSVIIMSAGTICCQNTLIENISKTGNAITNTNGTVLFYFGNILKIHNEEYVIKGNGNIVYDNIIFERNNKFQSTLNITKVNSEINIC